MRQDAAARGTGASDGASRSPRTICFPFAGGLAGGSHVSAVKLIQRLDPARFRPLVVLHRGGGQVEALLHREGVPFEPAPTSDFVGPANDRPKLQQLLGYPRLVGRLRDFLRDRGVSIVHTNDGAMHASWGLAARLSGAKLLWHHRGNPEAAGLKILAPLLANRVVSVSSFAAPRPGLWSAARCCTVVYSPFDRSERVEGAAEEVRAQLGLPENARLLGYFGNLTARKRPLIFVESIARLRERAPLINAHGLMFGDVLDTGSDLAVRERAASLGIADRIHLMGFRTPIEPWIQLCDLMLVPAVEEPFGRTIIEAMMLGTPVIAANSGGNIEAIRHGETGLLVLPDRPVAFANAAVLLLQGPAVAERIASTAREEALTKFGVDGHVRSISHIYDEFASAA